MTERPSVLHFTTTGAIAGTEQAVLDLSDAHDRTRFDVAYATLLSPGEMNRKIEANGAPCYSLDVRSALQVPAAAVRLARLLRSRNVDVLHTHLLHAGLVGVFATRLSGQRKLKLVHTRHHSDELHRFQPTYKARIDQYVAHSQDIVCANSLAAKSVLVNLEGVDERRIRLTYPGVHLPRLNARVTDPSGALLRRQLEFTSDHLLVGSVAHLLPKKGHRYLLQALTRVAANIPNVRLVIAGRGPEQAALEALACELGLREIIAFLGYRDDVPNVVSAFDLFVQPSIEEAFGLSMVEAMALGKPIVGSRVGGIPEVVEDGVTGMLVPPGDVPALSAAMSDLLLDSEKRRTFGEAGRIRAERLFTILRLATDYESAWNEVMQLDGR